MSADSWLTVKQQSAECEMTVGQLLADVLATVHPSSVQDVWGGGVLVVSKWLWALFI